jgi:hypothetical protein
MAFRAPAFLALPYASTADASPPQAAFILEETGGAPSHGAVSFTVSGPFLVEASTAPLSAGESRSVTVRCSASNAIARVEGGSVRIEVDGASIDVEIYCAVGDAALPATVAWTQDEYGSHAFISLPHAPFPKTGSVWTDSTVYVQIPKGFNDDGQDDFVCHFHGQNATISSVLSSHYYALQFAASGRDAIFILPQGPLNAASSDFGKLMDSGGMKDLCGDVLSILYRDGTLSRPRIGDLVLSSHSGGYQGAAAVISRGGVHVSAVNLFDSLYGQIDVFSEFGNSGGLLRSNYTSGGGTADDNAALSAALTGTVGTTFDDDELVLGRNVVGPIDSNHQNADVYDSSFSRWLRFSGLGPTSAAGTELRHAIYSGGNASLSWLPEAGNASEGFVVEGSSDGSSWTALGSFSGTEATVPAQPFLRVRRNVSGSEPSDVYGATGNAVLVVDALDRIIDNGYQSFRHGFAASVGHALGDGYSIASNEDVCSGAVDLGDYGYVVWLLGNEGKRDRTFTADERSIIAAFVASGGKIIVSGSEVGYATDGTFLEDTLHAHYVQDDSGTLGAGPSGTAGYSFGSAYPVDYPDVLSGIASIWIYSTGGGAAIGYDRRIVVVGFPIETINAGIISLALSDLTEYIQE